MGSPQNPTSEQVNELEKSGQLEMINKPSNVKIENNQFSVSMQLPRQAVALIKLVLE